jgi:pimeloyl-ACP methyl ester carboxylesterase
VGTIIRAFTYFFVSHAISHALAEAKSITERTVTLDNGQVIHWYQKGNPDAPLILFLHGSLEFGGEFYDQLRKFGGKDYLAIAPDIRGYNLSSKPPSVSDYHYEKAVEDVHLITANLKRKKFILVGHDLGGAIGWRYALKYPETLEGLVMLNGVHPFVYAAAYNDPHSNQRQAAHYIEKIRSGETTAGSLMADNFKELKSEVFPVHVPPSVESSFLKAWGQPGAVDAGLNFYRALDWPPNPPPAQFPPSSVISTPTLVIWGMRDPYVTKENVESPLLKMAVSNLTIKEIPEAGRGLVIQAPKKVNRYLREFLKSLPRN